MRTPTLSIGSLHFSFVLTGVHLSGRFALGHALINRESFEDIAQQVVKLALRPSPALVVTPNADHVVRLERNSELREAYAKAALVTPDGMPVVWASRWLGSPVKERVTGSDLMPRLCELAAESGQKVFLLGGAEGVADRAAANLVLSYPGLTVAGTLCPPPGFERDAARNADIVRTIRESGADLVFVCLGSPKQDVWASKHLSQFEKGVFLGVGAAIDFCAGTMKRAPAWMQRSGFEWLYRVVQEPRRMIGRYTKDLYFFVLVLRELWRQGVREAQVDAAINGSDESQVL
ncbi:WecB/TagA/CpsF family glycosyltransferase [Ramlibacter ginsenosidimutans]|uniref:WecB/TagA/CpsF family glycosyltransferase n=1 Tax=Ramlibacter ginsenosidimutans TaxID=502333 RepID=A0A934WLJ5_9BURK|nr:WecB/TagA/CpsF family glycosyltransferase [Ramlibacter ginsenosidimutans]MBK6005162.1 WecB/TagA/CpsF family glycosyltransferase [Ramlibacter ginsenosidimutans]